MATGLSTGHNFEALARFFLKHCENFNSTGLNEIVQILAQDSTNNCIDYLERNGEVVAAVRYGISQSGRIADIYDLAINKEENGKKIIRYFVYRGWSRFPSLHYISFERGFKKNNKNRLIEIHKFLKHSRRR